MKFGIREVCDCKFTKLSGVGPVEFIIDTAKMSTLDNSSSTVYAQGGQGYSRLLAWEGEKVVTFTVEDALISEEAFHALTGADRTATKDKVTYSIKTTSFAGFYSVEADTLFRELETGKDMPTKIKFPKVKLQTTLNLSMAPTGDPSTFTFTFDAFPDDKNELYSLEIAVSDAKTATNTFNITITNATSTTKLVTETASAVLLEIKDGKVQINGAAADGITITAGHNCLTNDADKLQYHFESTFLTAPGEYSFTTSKFPA